MKSKLPGIKAAFAEDHEEDDRLIKEIKQLAARIRSSSGAQRVALGVEINERWNAYLGVYLGHLYREESELQQALWDNLSEEELIAMDAHSATRFAK